jgi:probable HAF family extracellular repeat protein
MSELPLLPEATSSTAGAVNGAGRIVGVMSFPTAPFNRAVMWVAGTPEELPRLCATCNSTATDVNDAGDVSGSVTTADGFTSAAVWSSGTVTALPPLPGHASAMALSINNSGVLAGLSTNGDGVPRPVRWVNGLPEDLGHLDSGDTPFGVALAINDAGEIVGSVRPLDGQSERGFVWRDGVMTGLQTPPGETCNEFSAGLANNDSGLIVGYVFIDCRQTAAVWDHGVLRTLPALAEIPMFPAPQGGGSALDVNERGDIVGLGNPSFGPAALWRNGDAINLGALEPQTLPNGVAFDVNDAGVVVGWSRRTVGLRAVMWTTMPPATPAEQIDRLISEVSGVGPGRALDSTLRVALAAITSSRPHAAVVALTVFERQVTALARTGRLSADQASALLEASHQIRTTIGL